MTVEELERLCDDAEQRKAGFIVSRGPELILVVPGAAGRGLRKRVMPGVMGLILNERIVNGKPECTVAVKVKDVRRAIAKHRKANDAQS
jgi:hypothetical protein